MKKIYGTLILLLLVLKVYGQKIEKVFLDKNDTTKNCYTLIHPTTQPLKGCLFLIAGFGETPEDVLQQTDLPIIAAQNELLVVIPTFNDGVLSFGVDDASQQSFIRILNDVIKKNNLSEKKFYLGGFSIGGSAAVKYAETAFEKDHLVKPNALFAIDPPLDFERFYNSSKRDIRLSTNTQLSSENVYMVKRIKQVMGGTPQTALKNYYAISPYSFTDTTQQAIKSLVTVPIRIYSEPDVNWWINERGADFSAMNILDCSAMINELNRLGSKEAELIITENKGYRKPNHLRHPHSWSIVDNKELIEWLLKQ